MTASSAARQASNQHLSSAVQEAEDALFRHNPGVPDQRGGQGSMPGGNTRTTRCIMDPFLPLRSAGLRFPGDRCRRPAPMSTVNEHTVASTAIPSQPSRAALEAGDRRRPHLGALNIYEHELYAVTAGSNRWERVRFCNSAPRPN